MTFADLLKKHPEVVEDLMDAGMNCIGCPASTFETIEMGAMSHGIDPKELIDKINKKLAKELKPTKNKSVSKKAGTKKKEEKLSEEEINEKWEAMKKK